MARPPTAVTFPAEAMALLDSLQELLHEYVCRKHEVLANLRGSMPQSRRGIMSPNIWTKLRDIHAMSQRLFLPSLGWQQTYLLRCTVPRSWTPGSKVGVLE